MISSMQARHRSDMLQFTVLRELVKPICGAQAVLLLLRVVLLYGVCFAGA
jgi:hypothetical protein